MLPANVTLQLFEAMEDQQITTAEASGMITTVFGSAITGMVMAFGMMMFNRVLEHNPGNPGNPSIAVHEIISRAGLKPYEYKWFPEPEEKKPRVYPYRRAKEIGSYSVVMTRTDDACTIKLYEFLPGWKKKLRATWSGMGEVVCDKKFEEVCGVVRQVRFEERGVMRK